jgi:hypothetical protein
MFDGVGLDEQASEVFQIAKAFGCSNIRFIAGASYGVGEHVEGLMQELRFSRFLEVDHDSP